MRIVGVIFSILLGGLSTAALADDLAKAEALAKAIEESGCAVHPLNRKEVQAKSGLGMGEMANAMAHIGKFGEIEFPSDGILFFRSPTCEAMGINEETAAFVEVIEQHGCSLGEQEAPHLLPAAGYEKEDVKLHLIQLTRLGLVELDERGITLKTENCR